VLCAAPVSGGALNQQGSNFPLRGGKGGFFEGGLRVPAALSGGWLPHLLRGQTSSDLMSLADWYTTLSHAAGVDAADDRSDRVASVDGRSMWATWLGGSRAAAGAAEETIVLVDATVAYLQTTSTARRPTILKLSTTDLLLW
jgi:arylsulfatase A-like enzyme